LGPVNQPASLLQQTFSLPFVCQYQVLEAHVVNASPIANDPASALPSDIANDPASALPSYQNVVMSSSRANCNVALVHLQPLCSDGPEKGLERT
jgi:hypothetical protein